MFVIMNSYMQRTLLLNVLYGCGGASYGLIIGCCSTGSYLL